MQYLLLSLNLLSRDFFGVLDVDVIPLHLFQQSCLHEELWQQKRTHLNMTHYITFSNCISKLLNIMAALYLILFRFTFWMQELFAHFLVENGHWVVQLEYRKQTCCWRLHVWCSWDDVVNNYWVHKIQKTTLEELQDKIKINVSHTWMLKWSKMAVNSSFLFEISCPIKYKEQDD